jgi:hypothetical protein
MDSPDSLPQPPALRSVASRVAVLVALVLLSGSSRAQTPTELPCYAAGQPASVTLRWRAAPPPAAGEPASPISGYRLHRGTDPGAYSDMIVLEPQASADGMELAAAVPAWDPTRSFFVALSAYGPGGESERSNELPVPAFARACRGPGRPELLRIEVQLGAALSGVRQMLDQLPPEPRP